jgi:hypothetical protein
MRMVYGTVMHHDSTTAAQKSCNHRQALECTSFMSINVKTYLKKGEELSVVLPPTLQLPGSGCLPLLFVPILRLFSRP